MDQEGVDGDKLADVYFTRKITLVRCKYDCLRPTLLSLLPKSGCRVEVREEDHLEEAGDKNAAAEGREAGCGNNSVGSVQEG